MLVLEISLPGLRGHTFELLKWGQLSLIGCEYGRNKPAILSSALLTYLAFGTIKMMHGPTNIRFQDSVQKYNTLIKTAINPLAPNDPYIGRTAPLTSKRCILYIYSTHIGTE